MWGRVPIVPFPTEDKRQTVIGALCLLIRCKMGYRVMRLRSRHKLTAPEHRVCSTAEQKPSFSDDLAVVVIKRFHRQL